VRAKEDPEISATEEPIRPTVLLETTRVLSMITAVLSLFLFAWIAENVSLQRTEGFDIAVRSRIHQYASPTLTRVMLVISFMGSGGLILAALVAFALFLHYGWRRAAIWLVVTLAGALVLEITLKLVFHRPRPTAFFGPVPSTYSFPSGHSLLSLCFYGVLAGLLSARIRLPGARTLIWVLAVLLILAIGLSRIYLGVHYPSDVFAGYLTGTIWVTTMMILDRWRMHRGTRS
jgi:undecaprenyl-diphosphatase